MGGCCSKDSEGSVKDGLFSAFGGGQGEEEVASSTRRRRARRKVANPSFKERILALHAPGGGGGGSVGERKVEPSSVSSNYKINFGEDSCDSAAADTDVKCPLRGSICASPLDMTACLDFVPPIHPKSEEEAAFLRGALEENNFVFADLGDDALDVMVAAFEEACVPVGETLLRRGEDGEHCYVLQRGSVEFTSSAAGGPAGSSESSSIGTAGSGDTFGELILLYDGPSAVTAVATDNCVLWRVDRRTFRTVLARDAARREEESLAILRKLPFLEGLDGPTLARIAGTVDTVRYGAGEVVFRKGDEGGETLYAVRAGRVEVTDIEVGKSKYDDVTYGPGGYFGESSLLNAEQKRVANVVALDEVTLLRLRKQDFNEILGDFDEVMLRCNDKKMLMTMPLFKRSRVPDRDIAALARNVKAAEFPAGHIFYEEGQILDDAERAVCIVRSGTVTVTTKTGQIHALTCGGYFGDGNFGGAEHDGVDDGDGGDYVVARATVKATEACTLGVLSASGMRTVLGRDLAARLARVKDGESHPTGLDSSIVMEDLKRHRVLGAGTFGTVWLVSRGSETFALKIQRKRDLLAAQNQATAVVREKNIMASLDSPFVIKLFSANQDEKYLYMLMQLVQGGELFSVLHTETRNGIPESDAQFYAAGILEGLAHMHQRQVVYRDLKPENVLIDGNGYTVIVDLGFAKIVENKTYTLCGTPLYLAPEVILSRGHDRGADYWSLGILIYEMIVGKTPFYERDIEQLALLKKIVIGRYIFPRGKASAHARDVIKRLLMARPVHRLGSLAGGERDVREHDWFDGFEFGKLASREAEAPWRPKLDGGLDASNFEDLSHMNRQVDMSLPLSTKQQELFSDF